MGGCMSFKAEDESSSQRYGDGHAQQHQKDAASSRLSNENVDIHQHQQQKEDPSSIAGTQKMERQYWLSTVENEGNDIRLAPEHIRADKQITLVAVQNDTYRGDTLKYASPELRNDKEVVMAAVRQHGRALEHASPELQNDKEVVLAAVQQDASALNHALPECQDDKEIATEAVQNNGLALKYASPRLQNDREVILAAVQQNPEALQHSPLTNEVRNDRQIIMAAVQKNGQMLIHASPTLQADKEVLFLAAGSLRVVLEWDRAMKEVFLRAVKQNCMLFKEAPETVRNNKDIALEAVRQNCLLFIDAPETIRNDKDIALEAVRQNCILFNYVSVDLRSDKQFVLEAVGQNIQAIRHAPHELQIHRDIKLIFLEAVSRNGMLFQEAPESLLNDKAFFLEAFKQNVKVLQGAPEAFRDDKDLAITAVNHDGLLLQYLSDRLRADRDVVEAAAASNCDSLKFALNGMAQDEACLKKAGVWDDKRKQNVDTKFIVLSTRFAFTPDSSSRATEFAVLLKEHILIQCGNFDVFSPNAINKSTCDPQWTSFDWPCRGTFATCSKDSSLKTGVPQNDSCWRYSYRYQLERAKRSNGFMIQLVEVGKTRDGYTEGRLQTQGDGQRIETDMAKDVPLKLFRVYVPIEHRGDTSKERERHFTEEDIDTVVSEISDWYGAGCWDISEQTITFN